MGSAPARSAVDVDRLPPGQPAGQGRHAREFGQLVRRRAIQRPRQPVSPQPRQIERAERLGVIERDEFAVIGRHRAAVSDLAIHG
jgi:hypothetical protein